MSITSLGELAFHLAMVGALWAIAFLQARSARKRGWLKAHERARIIVIFACGLVVLTLAVVLAIFGR